MAEANQTVVPEPVDRGRRRILSYLLGFTLVSSLAGVLAPILGYLVPPDDESGAAGGRVLVGTTKDIPIGQGKVVPMGSTPVIVVNTEQGVTAFSAICTHLGCIVLWDDMREVILCPCHDGLFNPINGMVIGGPPPAPLPPVPVRVEGDDIYIGEV